MGAYNRVTVNPAAEARKLLYNGCSVINGVLKVHVTSDCWAIKDFHEGTYGNRYSGGISGTAMNSGCDLNCGNIFGNLIFCGT